MRILAGDIGGTKSNLALFESDSSGRLSPPASPDTFLGADFVSFEEMLGAYRRRHAGAIDAACFGVAGPPIAGRVRGTHMAWDIDSAVTSAFLSGAPVDLLNDLVATGYSVPALSAADLAQVQEGVPDLDANAALISAGTGLGESLLARVDEDLVPIASEGGHADFAPRNEDEIDLFRVLRSRFGRVSVERVLSGPGLVNIARWIHARGNGDGSAAWALHETEALEYGLPALVSRVGLTGECPWCTKSLEFFVSAYGAEAGNLALRGVTRAGVYLGGGIAPKILEALQTDNFRRSFHDKEPHRELLLGIPVWVILNERAPVLGAARYAALTRSGAGAGTGGSGAGAGGSGAHDRRR